MVLVVTGAGAATAQADDKETPVERCVSFGDKQLEQARSEPQLYRREQLALAVRQLCERAQQGAPLDPKPHIVLSRTWLVADPAHPEQCVPGACEKALSHLVEARRLDRHLENGPRIALDTALVYSRMSRFTEAIAEYDRALRYVSEARLWNDWYEAFDDSMLWGNSAESLMALGRLEESVERYRKAVATALPGSLGWALGLWGLGVALDRDGQVELSRRAIRSVLDLDPAMGRLRSDSVFFEPPGDIWYYTALGHEVSGDLARAAEHFGAFLREAPRSPYAPAARRHLRLLEREKLVKSPTGRVSISSADGDPDRWVAFVRQQFERHMPELQLCYDRVLLKVPLSRGLVRFVVTFTDRPNVDVSPRPGPMTEPFAICVSRQMGAWRWDYQGGSNPEATIVIELGGKT